MNCNTKKVLHPFLILDIYEIFLTIFCYTYLKVYKELYCETCKAGVRNSFPHQGPFEYLQCHLQATQNYQLHNHPACC